MGKDTIDDKLEKYSKRSRNIQYSTNVLNNNGEEPKIILRELKESDRDKDWVLVFKYKINDIPQEVIMGLLKDTQNKKVKIMEILKFMRGQLEENRTNAEGYESLIKLESYIKRERVPFELTPEGLKILYSKDKENISILRTHYEDSNGKINKVFLKADLDKMKKDMTFKIKEYIEKKEKQNKWLNAREKFLNIKDEVTVSKFLKGEEILKIMENTEISKNDSDEVIEQKKKEQKDIAIQELFQSYNVKMDQDNSNLNDEQKQKLLLTAYLKIKEKGIIHDINTLLENIENEMYLQIYAPDGNIQEKYKDKLKNIQNYEQFFKLVQNGMDLNARIFALKIYKIDFNELKDYLKESGVKDEELFKYLNMKENLINELGTDNVQGKEEQYKSIEELDKFLINSSVREYTKKDDELIISGVYKLAKEKLLEDNLEEIYEYNSLAKKYDMPLCPMPEKTKKDIDFHNK